MPAKRVLHVYRYFRPKFTGEGIFLERLAPYFATLRSDIVHDVLVTVTARPNQPPTLRALGTVHYLMAEDTASGASQREIISWLARHGSHYDTVHYHTHVDRTFLASWLLKLRGCRVVLSATLDDSIEGLLKTYRPALRPLVRLLSAAVDRFVAISPKLFAQNNRFVPAAKSVLIPIGIALPDLTPMDRQKARDKLGISAHATVLVSVGGICRRKDQLFLVRQMPALLKTNPDLLLVLVGPGLEADYCAEIESVIAEKNIQSHVRLAGYSDRPWDFYRASDVMVFASHEEGFGTVVIEAMAHGLPVVVRRLAGVNDAFVEVGKSGYLFDREEEFRSQLAGLIADAGFRRSMGEAGRGFVAANFNIAKVAGQYLAVYGLPAGTDIL